MRVNMLDIRNFRCVHELELNFHKQMNILIGVNGAGKSSILDCLAILLSRLVGRIRSTKGTGRFFTASDITIDENATINLIKISLDIKDQEESLEWMVTKYRHKEKKQKISNLEHVKKTAEAIRHELGKDMEMSIPLAVYYSVNRAVIDIPLRIRKKHEFEQISAYDQVSSGGRNDFRIFFEWFRNREDLENEKRVRQADYRDRQLGAVRCAVEKFLPGFTDLRVQRSPLRMTVQIGDQELNVNQLSDGEKCLLAMIGDLARRLAIANPSVNNPLHGKGVVMIDEVDLHLHPSWQRIVVPLLESTFPNCQLILTTHSAQVLSHVRDPESIFLLKFTDGGIQAKHPESVYGLDSNRILEDLMDVPERPGEIKILIENLFDTIDKKDLEKARNQLDNLKQKIGTDPQLTKAEVLIRRMEIIGK